jgi:hypothetical protein
MLPTSTANDSNERNQRAARRSSNAGPGYAAASMVAMDSPSERIATRKRMMKRARGAQQQQQSQEAKTDMDYNILSTKSLEEETRRTSSLLAQGKSSKTKKSQLSRTGSSRSLDSATEFLDRKRIDHVQQEKRQAHSHRLNRTTVQLGNLSQRQSRTVSSAFTSQQSPSSPRGSNLPDIKSFFRQMLPAKSKDQIKASSERASRTIFRVSELSSAVAHAKVASRSEHTRQYPHHHRRGSDSNILAWDDNHESKRNRRRRTSVAVSEISSHTPTAKSSSPSSSLIKKMWKSQPTPSRPLTSLVSAALDTEKTVSGEAMNSSGLNYAQIRSSSENEPVNAPVVTTPRGTLRPITSALSSRFKRIAKRNDLVEELSSKAALRQRDRAKKVQPGEQGATATQQQAPDNVIEHLQQQHAEFSTEDEVNDSKPRAIDSKKAFKKGRTKADDGGQVPDESRRSFVQSPFNDSTATDLDAEPQKSIGSRLSTTAVAVLSSAEFEKSTSGEDETHPQPLVCSSDHPKGSAVAYSHDPGHASWPSEATERRRSRRSSSGSSTILKETSSKNPPSPTKKQRDSTPETPHISSRRLSSSSTRAKRRSSPRASYARPRSSLTSKRRGSTATSSSELKERSSSQRRRSSSVELHSFSHRRSESRSGTQEEKRLSRTQKEKSANPSSKAKLKTGELSSSNLSPKPPSKRKSRPATPGGKDRSEVRSVSRSRRNRRRGSTSALMGPDVETERAPSASSLNPEKDGSSRRNASERSLIVDDIMQNGSFQNFDTSKDLKTKKKTKKRGVQSSSGRLHSSRDSSSSKSPKRRSAGESGQTISQRLSTSSRTLVQSQSPRGSALFGGSQQSAAESQKDRKEDSLGSLLVKDSSSKPIGKKTGRPSKQQDKKTLETPVNNRIDRSESTPRSSRRSRAYGKQEKQGKVQEPVKSRDISVAVGSAENLLMCGDRELTDTENEVSREVKSLKSAGTIAEYLGKDEGMKTTYSPQSAVTQASGDGSSQPPPLVDFLSAASSGDGSSQPPPLADFLSVDLSTESSKSDSTGTKSDDSLLQRIGEAQHHSRVAQGRSIQNKEATPYVKSKGTATDKAKANSSFANLEAVLSGDKSEGFLGECASPNQRESLDISRLLALDIFDDSPENSPLFNSEPPIRISRPDVAIVERLASSMPNLDYQHWSSDRVAEMVTEVNGSSFAKAAHLDAEDFFEDDSSGSSTNSQALPELEAVGSRKDVMTEITDQVERVDEASKMRQRGSMRGSSLPSTPVKSGGSTRFEPQASIARISARLSDNANFAVGISETTQGFSSPRSAEQLSQKGKLDRGPRKPQRRKNSFGSEGDEADAGISHAPVEAKRGWTEEPQPATAAGDSTVQDQAKAAPSKEPTQIDESLSPMMAFGNTSMEFHRTQDKRWIQTAPTIPPGVEMHSSVGTLNFEQDGSQVRSRPSGLLRRSASTGDIRGMDASLGDERWGSRLAGNGDLPSIPSRQQLLNERTSVSLDGSELKRMMFGLPRGGEEKSLERTYLPVSLQSAVRRYDRTGRRSSGTRRTIRRPANPSPISVGSGEATLPRNAASGGSSARGLDPGNEDHDPGLSDMFEMIGELAEDIVRFENQIASLRVERSRPHGTRRAGRRDSSPS